MSTSLPLVGIPTVERMADGMPSAVVRNMFIDALYRVSKVMPVNIPSLVDPADAMGGLMMHLDGVFLTGGISHMQPQSYGANFDMPDCEIDPARDAMALALVRQARRQNLPLFGVCRGMQEMNVALGGTLEHNVHAPEGRLDHRSDRALRTLKDKLTKLAHPVAPQPGGRIASWFGSGAIMVNSLHEQGIERVAPELTVEALAPDGIVEALSLPDQPFFIGVQWHPEYDPVGDPVSRRLFEEFGDAVRAHATKRS